jgi:hypothetical protein
MEKTYRKVKYFCDLNVCSFSEIVTYTGIRIHLFWQKNLTTSTSNCIEIIAGKNVTDAAAFHMTFPV